MSTTYRAQIEALLAAGAYPGAAEVAAQIGCAGSTAKDYRQRWQRANGKQHDNGSGIMPREVVDFVFDLRDEGLQFGQIAQRVNEEHGEYYGIHVTAGQCGNVYRRHGYKKPARSRVVNVADVTFPLPTRVGTMWDEKITAPRYPRTKANKYKDACDFCPHLVHCLAHPGDVCRCETAQVDEVLEVS